MIRDFEVTLYSQNLQTTRRFYQGFGFAETFRYPKTGEPHHIELTQNNFKLGIVNIEKASADHGFATNRGHTAELVFWNDDTNGLFKKPIGEGASVISEPHDWLENLRVAWVGDPGGNPIQLVQKRMSGQFERPPAYAQSDVEMKRF